MPSSSIPQRFALLVGVDWYMTDDSRKHENGDPVKLNNLGGCVRDVQIIQNVLQTSFGLHKPRVLTSPAAPNKPEAPWQPENDWPTLRNIKREFDTIYTQACPGDLFFFHFSGHGAHLKTTAVSPAGRTTDPSLMTSDYCYGKPAVRGWQLNEWLRRFHDKGVRVTVVLDSCFSGGSWRIDGITRSPEDWTPPPNLPADEAAVQGAQSKPGNRKGDLEKTWDIDPEGFTLMAACREDQGAGERWSELYKATCGVFTAALGAYSNLSQANYRVIREQIAGKIRPQEPQVFGQDRLVFFKDRELLSVTTIPIQVQGNVINLPVGKAHGVVKGAEFITYPPAPRVILSAFQVQDIESKAEVIGGQIQTLQDSTGLIPYRWSFSGTLRIFVDPCLGTEFRTQLRLRLEERVVGNVQVVECTELPAMDDTRDVWFWLKLDNSKNIALFGPEAVLGSQGRVRGWKTESQSNHTRAVDSAVALAHLTRFTQLLHLRSNTSQNLLPFAISLTPDAKEGPFQNGQKFKLTFQCHKSADLFFTVIIFSSGFHVRQLFPVNDSAMRVQPNGVQSFSFSLSVPDELKDNDTNGEQYRDIVRIVATRGKKLSVKYMELPDIWNANEVDRERTANTARYAELVRKCSWSWWVQDYEVWLKRLA